MSTEVRGNRRPTASLRQRGRYLFDNTMSAGPMAMVGWLTVLSLAVVIVAAIFLLVTDTQPGPGESLGFVEAAWQSLMRTMDAGTMGGDEGWPFRLIMLLVTVGGIFVVSSLIGVLTSGIDSKLEQLRKGRSFVVESDHTLVLGWSPKVHRIISELAIANENQSRGRIVVLADRDKVEMEEAIRSTGGDLGGTRVICRTGNPQVPGDVEIVNPSEAKSIIVLAPPEPDGDAHTLKTLLALLNDPDRQTLPSNIVAEIQDPQNLEIAAIIGREHGVQLIWSDQIIAHITAQTCRQSGLSAVYTELLDFAGDEIYFAEVPAVAGQPFGDALLRFETSALIGIRTADGTIILNPPMEQVVAPGDALIAIAADDDRIAADGDGAALVDEAAIAPSAAIPPVVERTLVLNWNRRGDLLIRELDRYVTSGSQVLVVASDPDVERAVATLDAELPNATVTFRSGDPTQRHVLEEVLAGGFDHIVILHAGSTETQEGDTRSIITLLQLRDIAERTNVEYSIVTEILDRRNQELARVTQADDFIVSEEVISLMLAQVSEHADLNRVFADIFDADHSEITLHPAANYVVLDRTTTFATVVEAARRRGQVAIGYRRNADASNAARAYGVVMNPPKSQQVSLTRADRVIVLAH